jgi:hypothetical protein
MLIDQVAAGVPQALQIETAVSPPAPPVLYATGSRARAFASVVVLGLIFTVIAVAFTDRWIRRRRQDAVHPNGPESATPREDVLARTGKGALAG